MKVESDVFPESYYMVKVCLFVFFLSLVHEFVNLLKVVFILIMKSVESDLLKYDVR